MKKTYQSPTLKVVQFKSECGFATSSGFSARSLGGDLMEFEMTFASGDEPCNEQYEFVDGTDFWN